MGGLLQEGECVVIELRKISANPWDYTLYESSDGSFVLKVMFSDGEYKIDIGRYFQLILPDEESKTTGPLN